MKIKFYIYLFTFILLFLLGTNIDSSRKFIIRSLGGYTDKVQIHTIDTLEIEVDTLKLIEEWKKLNPDSIKRTTIINNEVIDTIALDTLVLDIQGIIVDSTYIYKWAEIYKSFIEDSLIKGEIETKVDIMTGKLLYQNFDYKPKFPIIIEKKIPILETITETISNDYKYGIGGSTNNLGHMSIIGAYQNKNGWQYNVSYEFPNKYIDTGSIRVGVLKFF